LEQNFLNQIRIILIETTHSGNIGSTARAMKTMGLSDLVLVNPQDEIDDQARALSSNALDVLDNAKIVKTLGEAIADCDLILGTSARKRYLDWPLITPREAAEKSKDIIFSGMKVGIIFGRERNGLINEELERCHMHVHIPTNPDYSSLNLAQAVQLISYEMRLSLLDPKIPSPKDQLAKPENLEGFYGCLEEVLLDIGFLDPKAPRKLMPRLRRLFQRVVLEETELNILRGIFEEIKKKNTRKN